MNLNRLTLRTLLKCTTIYLLICLLQACAVHSTLFKNDETIAVTQKSEYQSFYTIANAGADSKGPYTSFTLALASQLKKTSKKKDYLLFLGDNLHNSDLDANEIELQLKKQLDLSSSFKGTSLFLSGEQEWNDTGTQGLEGIEDYIEEYLKEEDHFLPKNGCPLEIIDVSDDIELFIINSQWYIEDWSKVKGMNDKCEIKTRIQFETLLAGEMRKARHKTVIIAMHHPLYANGVYGGEIPAEVVYKPVSENVFIPAVGSIWSFLRSQGGLSKQDRYNPLMNELMQTVESAAFDIPRVFVLSGHERSLQYIDHNNIKQIISGTASSVKPARLGKRGLFTATLPGYAEVRVYPDGSSSSHFFTFENEKFSELFNKISFEAQEPFDIENLPKTFPKTKIASIYPPESVIKSDKYEKFWGKHYRYVYGVNVEAPVAILDTLYGGLKVERAGGGNQTNGLRLVTKDDREYNMRAIEKDPIAFLKSAGYTDIDAESYFNKSVPAKIIKDFYTAAHPYGAFAIPRLAGALKLPHTHPKLYYIPKQAALGNFNSTHGDQLYMIVEKPDGDFDDSHMFKFSQEVESTPDLFKELREDDKHQLDERMYIRARIFDMLVGDWDRHEDQWRWAQDKTDEEEGITTYTPVPRDRDQVFAKFDGNFLTRLQKIMSAMRQFGNYGPDLPFVEQFSESAINLDRALVIRSDKSVWLEEVAYIQQHITKDVVTKAFSEAPLEVQDDIWKGIQDDLLSRKQNLNDIVNRYYDHFSKFQVVKGTDKDDQFVIENLDNGNVHVLGHRIKDGEKGAVLLDRVYDARTTQDIWIYGLDDKDVFEVKANEKSSINVVLIGGLDEDTFSVEGGKNYTIYDQKSYDNVIESKGKATRHIDDIYENHIYDSERRPDSGGLFGLESMYNPDEGFSPRILFGKTTLGYERHPFTTKLALDARYISLTQAADVRLEWHKAHLFHDWNFRSFGHVTTANYTENFFGLGNGSENLLTSFDANRVPLQYLVGGIGLYYNGEYGSGLEIDISYENIDVRVLDNTSSVFSDTKYVTYAAIYEYKSIDDNRYPTRGMQFKLRGSFSDEITSLKTVGAIDPSLTFWNAIDSSRDIVFKTKVSGQLRLGDNIPFYQLAQLGANKGLRSYRQGRFTGQQALTGSVDLSYNFKPIRTALFPVRLDGFIGYDTGRVWITEEQNETLHYSYGGGLNFSTVAALKGNISYFNGPEGGRLGFGVSLGL